MKQMKMSIHRESGIDASSGFCRNSSTFFSKRQSVDLPPPPVNHSSLDVTTFFSSLPQPNHGKKIAYIDSVTGNHLTYADLWKSVHILSLYLSEMGIRKGHVILLLSPNSIFIPIVCLSVMLLGAIITTANPVNTFQEISKQIAQCNVSIAFTIPQLLPKLNNILPVVLMGENNSDILETGVKIIGILQEILLMKHQPNKTPLRETVTQDDTALLLYSSGTSGEGKAVMTTHRNLIAGAEISAGRYRTHELDQIYLAVVPMFHAYGLLTFVFRLLPKGCTMVVMPKFHMDDMLMCIRKYNVTYLPLAPPIIVSLMKDADEFKELYDLKSLRYILSSAGPLSKQVSEQFEGKFPDITLLQAYTMTEANGAGADMHTTKDRRFGSVGLLTPSTEARIVEPNTGAALPVNSSGELWLRGQGSINDNKTISFFKGNL